MKFLTLTLITMKINFIKIVFSIGLSLIGLWSTGQCSISQTNELSDLSTECGSGPLSFGTPEFTSTCCDGPIEVISELVQTGADESNCSLTPAYGPGPDWALWLPGVNPNSVVWMWDSNGVMHVSGDGHAIVTGHVYSAADPSQGFDVFMLLGNGRNWTEWSALGRGYKNDLNLAGSNFQDWMYYEMLEGYSYLRGTGSLEGSFLSLSHKPANYYFGYQVGMAANNKNANNGMSGWFLYSGTLNGTTISGHGDINVDQSCNDTNDDCGSSASTTYWRAQDACGNVGYASQTISSLDTTAPVFNTFEESVTVECGLENTVSIGASDACSSYTVSYSDEIIEEGCNGLIMRTYTATDACGNASIAVQYIYLESAVELMFLTFPENIIAECGQWNDNSASLVTYTEGCGNPVLTSSDEILAGNCGNTYTLVRTYTLTDECGASLSQIWTVEIQDNTAPVIYNAPAAEITLECGVEPAPDNIFAIDACEGILNVSLSAETISSDCGYTFIRTWTATDACGNSSAVSQTITYVDNQGPVFTFVPESTTIVGCESGGFDLGDALASDACGEATVTFTDSEQIDGCSTIFTRTYVAQDGCGNTTTTSASIIYIDNEAPVLVSGPESIEASCGTTSDFMPEYPVFTDNCSEVMVSVQSDFISPGACEGSYTRMIIFQAIDACGNVSSYEWTASVQDNEAPIFVSLPEAVVDGCNGQFVGEAVATDNCGSVAVSFEDTPLGNCGGSFTRTYTATDACGNTVSESITLNLQDIISPVLVSGPESIEIGCGESYEIPSAPVFSDNCSDVTVEITADFETPGFCAGTSTRTIVWEATDACGNKFSYEWTATTRDLTAPVFVTLVEDMEMECGETAPEVEMIATDDCSTTEVYIEFIETTEPIECGYALIRSWTAYDDCGNSTTATQTISFYDTQGPSFNWYPEDVTYNCGDDYSIYEIPTATDVCAGDVEVAVTILPLGSECPGTESFLRLYRAFDDCGNSAIYYQTVTIIDNIGPEFINTPSEVFVQCDELTSITAQAIDVCSGEADIIIIDVPNMENCGQIIERTYIASDACGNTTEFIQTIYTIDETAPVIYNTPAAELTLGCSEAIPDVFLFALDNCMPDVPIALTASTVETECGYIFTRTWTAFDYCNNEASFTQVITVEDQAAPVLSEMPSDVTISCDANLPDTPVITALDDCGGILPVDFQEETIGLDICPTFVRTWCATDCAGNTTCHTQTITFEEIQAVANFRVDPGVYGETLIKWTSSQDETVRFAIYNMAGQKLTDAYLLSASAGTAHVVSIDTSRLPGGIYIMQSQSDSGTYTQRFVIR